MSNSRIIITLLAFTALFASCKKDNDTEKGFDLNNPEEYCIYLKSQNADGSNPTVFLLSFDGESLPDGRNAVTQYQVLWYFGNGIFLDLPRHYTVQGKDSLIVPGIARFKIENGKIRSAISDESGDKIIHEYALIKKSETNQLAGKSFTGKYFRMSKEIFRNSFFYRFDTDVQTLAAGLTVPNAERSGKYESIGNIAAVSFPENGTVIPDVELLIKVNNTLRSQYYDNVNERIYYGEFTQQ